MKAGSYGVIRSDLVDLRMDAVLANAAGLIRVDWIKYPAPANFQIQPSSPIEFNQGLFGGGGSGSGLVPVLIINEERHARKIHSPGTPFGFDLIPMMPFPLTGGWWVPAGIVWLRGGSTESWTKEHAREETLSAVVVTSPRQKSRGVANKARFFCSRAWLWWCKEAA
jgi:hypothetical protein